MQKRGSNARTAREKISETDKLEAIEVHRGRCFIAVTRSNRGQRLDRFLQDSLAPLSRNAIKRRLDRGQVRLAGRPVRLAGRCLTGDEVFEVRDIPVLEVHAELEESQICYEDAHILAVNKPAGLRMHPVERGDAHNLVSALARYLETQHADAKQEVPRVVSRLDRETSGIVVLARSQEAARALTEAFSAREVHKVYRALVHGHPEDDGMIALPIGPIGLGRFGERAEGKPARTRYRVVQRKDDITEVEVFPETGRTHQIRVHLAWQGTPIVGDLLYGGRRRPGVLRALLHAEVLRLTHPITGEELELHAPLPRDFGGVIATGSRGHGPTNKHDICG